MTETTLVKPKTRFTSTGNKAGLLLLINQRQSLLERCRKKLLQLPELSTNVGANHIGLQWSSPKCWKPPNIKPPKSLYFSRGNLPDLHATCSAIASPERAADACWWCLVLGPQGTSDASVPSKCKRKLAMDVKNWSFLLVY